MRSLGYRRPLLMVLLSMATAASGLHTRFERQSQWCEEKRLTGRQRKRQTRPGQPPADFAMYAGSVTVDKEAGRAREQAAGFLVQRR